MLVLRTMPLPELPFWVDKKYRAIRLLGQGGGGYALLAEWEKKQIVIKILRLNVLKNREKSIATFKKEFLTLKQLNHPHIGELFDFGYDSEHDFYYFAGEYIAGPDILEVSRTIPLDLMELLFVQALQALHYLNSFGRAGLRHNDIKTANILIDQTGKSPQLKLIDFGLSKMAPLDVLGGTASYMAPEQIVFFATNRVAKNQDPEYRALLKDLPKMPKPDQRADLYSLGVAWYLCLTGINPFFIPLDTIGSLRRHFNTHPSPPSQIRHNIPKYLDDIILRLLAINPDERFETPAEVIRELNYLSGKKYSVIPGEMRKDYLPESEWIQSSEGARELKKRWQSKKSLLTWIVGDAGQGKSSLLAELKNHVQANEGKFYLWEEMKNRDGLFEETSPLLISTEKESLLGEILQRIEYQQSWSPESQQVIQVAVTTAKLPASPPPTRLPSQTVHLRNLTQEELKKRLQSLSKDKKSEPPEKFVASFFRHTQGNPRIVSHVLKELMQQGMLLDDHGHWDSRLLSDISIDIGRLSIPPELKSQIEYRWQHLSSEEREILKWLAIVPEGLAESDLYCLNPKLSYSSLTQLSSAGLIAQQRQRLFFENPFWEKIIDSKMTTSEKRKRHHGVVALMRKQKRPPHQIAIHQIFSNDSKERLQAYTILIDFYQKTNQPEAELTILKIRFQEIPTEEESWKIARRLRELGETAKAKLWLESWKPGEPIWQAMQLCEWGDLTLEEHDSKKARLHFEKALTLLPNGKKYQKEETSIQNRIAQSWLEERNLIKAAALFKKTRLASLNFGLPDNDLGYVHLLQQKPKAALKILSEDLKYFSKQKNGRKQMRCYFLLASTLRQLERSFTKAIGHYHHGIELARNLKDHSWLMRFYNGMAATYLDHAQEKGNSQDCNQALRYFQESLAICQHLQKNKTDLDLETAAIHLNIGMTHHEMGNTSKARNAFETILKVLEPIPIKGPKENFHLCQTYIAMADSFAAEGKFREMHKPLQNAQDIIQRQSNFKEQKLALILLLAQQANGLGDKTKMKEYLLSVQKFQSKEKIIPTPYLKLKMSALSDEGYSISTFNEVESAQ